MVRSYVANVERKHCEFESRRPLQNMACGTAWCSRRPVTAEVQTGSNPVQVAKCRRSLMVKQLPCKQKSRSSILLVGSNFIPVSLSGGGNPLSAGAWRVRFPSQGPILIEEKKRNNLKKSVIVY